MYSRRRGSARMAARGSIRGGSALYPRRRAGPRYPRAERTGCTRACGTDDEVPLRARARRAPGARRARDHRLPLQLRLGPGRVPVGRPVLHSLGLPDHEPPDHGVAPERHGRAAGVLGAPGAPPPARAARPPRVRGDLHPDRDRAVEPRRRTRRRHREPLLRRELALHRREAGLLRAVLGRVASAPYVDARDRRAVLSRVATRRVRRHAREPGFAACARGGVRCGFRDVDRRDGDHLRSGRPAACVLRQRRPRPHHPHRRAARDPPRVLDAERGGAAPARVRRDRGVCRDDLRVARRHRHQLALLPRRIGRVRRACLRGDHGRPAAGGVAQRARVPAAQMDRPALLRPLPVPLAVDRVARAHARAPARLAVERAAVGTDVRRRRLVLLSDRGPDPRAPGPSLAAPPARVTRACCRDAGAAAGHRPLVGVAGGRRHPRDRVRLQHRGHRGTELPERHADTLVQLPDRPEGAAVGRDRGELRSGLDERSARHVRDAQDQLHLVAR